MNASAFEDRHPVLDPQQRLIDRELGKEETCPTAIARMVREQLGKSGMLWLGQTPAFLRKQESAWVPLAGAQELAGLERANRAPPATRDKPLATLLTTFLF